MSETHDRFCSVCESHLISFAPGPGGRPNSRCPRCHSLERHRYLALLLSALPDEIAASQHTLEVAPTRSITRLLRERGTRHYVGVDVNPEADGRFVQVVADLCSAPFPAGAFQVAICFHVFEHIPDDSRAMTEFARILAPDGIGFIQNPWRPTDRTQEDPAADAKERERRFGQADHVRIYGFDFEDRLRSVGLEPRRLLPEQVVSSEVVETMELTPRMPIWLVFGSRSPYHDLRAQELGSRLGVRVEEWLSTRTSKQGNVSDGHMTRGRAGAFIHRLKKTIASRKKDES